MFQYLKDPRALNLSSLPINVSVANEDVMQGEAITTSSCAAYRYKGDNGRDVYACAIDGSEEQYTFPLLQRFKREAGLKPSAAYPRKRRKCCSNLTVAAQACATYCELSGMLQTHGILKPDNMQQNRSGWTRW